MFQRLLETAIIQSLTAHPALLIHGPRGAGKSTLLEGLSRRVDGSRLLNLEDPEVAHPARTDPQSFLAGPEPVLLDEIGKAPELIPVLAESVRRDPRPGRFLLSASAFTPELRSAVTDHPDARAWLDAIPFGTFSQGELRGREESFLDRLFAFDPEAEGSLEAALATPPLSPGAPRDDLGEILLRGGYPDIHVRHWQAPKRTAWFAEHVPAVLRLDLPDLARLGDMTPFPRLLRLLAARVGRLLNTSEIGRASGLPYATLTRYLEALEALHLHAPLPAWFGPGPPRLTRAPRIYLVDAGLAAHLARVTDGTLPSDRTLLEPLLRNLMVQEVRKQAARQAQPPRLSHFRTAIGEEVDLVVERADGETAALILSGNGELPESTRRGLSRLRRLLSGRRLRVVRLIPRLPGSDGALPPGAAGFEALWSAPPVAHHPA